MRSERESKETEKGRKPRFFDANDWIESKTTRTIVSSVKISISRKLIVRTGHENLENENLHKEYSPTPTGPVT